MKHYTVHIINDTIKPDVLEIFEMNRTRFSKRDYKIILDSIFFWNAQNCDFNKMRAEVFCNDKPVLTIRGEVRLNGCEIWTDIFANDEYVRTMNIAT